MDDLQLQLLRDLAAAFRGAIEAARIERLPGALPYFPDGACRLTSRLFARHLATRADGPELGAVTIASGVLPGSEHGARHFWLEIDGTVIDLTADPFGEAPVIVGERTPFHQSLTSPISEDAATVLAGLSADETARLARQLATIEARLAQPPHRPLNH